MAVGTTPLLYITKHALKTLKNFEALETRKNVFKAAF